MDLPALLKTIRKLDTQGGGEPGPGIAVADGELNWLLRFHEGLRNQFIHFSPQGWSIEISGLPGLAELTARIITGVLDAGWGFRHKNLAWCEALRVDLEGLSSPRLSLPRENARPERTCRPVQPEAAKTTLADWLESRLPQLVDNIAAWPTDE